MSWAAVWSQSVLVVVVVGGGGGGVAGAVACEDSPSNNGRHFLHKRVCHMLRDKVGDMGGTGGGTGGGGGLKLSGVLRIGFGKDDQCKQAAAERHTHGVVLC